jgi:hypothetical protein
MLDSIPFVFTDIAGTPIAGTPIAWSASKASRHDPTCVHARISSSVSARATRRSSAVGRSDTHSSRSSTEPSAAHSASPPIAIATQSSSPAAG